MTDRELLERLETILRPGGELEAWSSLAFVAARRIDFGDDLNAARRRALLLLAAGGDPHRELELGGRAARALADDLDEPGRRDALTSGLGELRPHADGLPAVREALGVLLADGELAWRALAVALLAEELDEEPSG